MDKKEVQKRVLLNGVPLSLENFTWDEETKTFSSKVDGLKIDLSFFGGITFNLADNCTAIIGDESRVKAGNRSVIVGGFSCQVETQDYCRLEMRMGCSLRMGFCCSLEALYNTTVKAGSSCSIKVGDDSNLDIGPYCRVMVRSGSKLRTLHSCTIEAMNGCILIRKDLPFKKVRLPEEKKVRLNGPMKKGYTVL